MFRGRARARQEEGPLAGRHSIRGADAVVLVSLDHAAVAAAAGTSVAESRHRIAPRAVEKEVAAAGFLLEDVSPHLRNPQDDHTRSAFDASVRGRTDRFFHLYRKPAVD